jgi:hypothetical protein
MLAPLITLAFLVTLWACAVVAAEMFGVSRSRIFAALRGETRESQTILEIRMPPRRTGYARWMPMRARPQMRAAA